MLFISEQKFNNSVKKNHRPWSSINLNLVPRLISSFFFLVPFVLSSNRSKRKEYYLAFSFVTFLAQKIAMRMFQKKKRHRSWRYIQFPQFFSFHARQIKVFPSFILSWTLSLAVDFSAWPLITAQINVNPTPITAL